MCMFCAAVPVAAATGTSLDNKQRKKTQAAGNHTETPSPVQGFDDSCAFSAGRGISYCSYTLRLVVDLKLILIGAGSCIFTTQRAVEKDARS